MASRKSISKENRDTVRKSILRNPEIPLQRDNKPKNIKIQEPTQSCNEPRESKAASSKLAEPKVNKLAEWRKTLNEIKNYTTKEIKNMEDVSRNTQDFINRAVSSKLNFPSNQPVFKNLPKIEDEIAIQNTIRSIQKVHVPRKLDSKNEIQRLLNELVEAEYKNEVINQRINLSQSYTDEWLEINKKFREPTFKVPKQKSETQIYHEQLRKDLYNHLFASEDYLSSQIKFNPDTDQPNRKSKDCKCMSDFYSQHSMCS